MSEAAEIQRLEAELAALEAQSLKMKEPKKHGYPNAVNALDTPIHNKGEWPWLGKVAAKAAVSPFNLPVLGANAVQWARGKEGFEYPSNIVGNAIESIGEGRAKAKPGFQENIEPYAESLLSLPFGGGAGKGLQALGKIIPKGGKVLEYAGKGVGAGTKLTTRTAAANVGALYGARKASENYEDNPIASLVGLIVGGFAGRGAINQASNLRKLPGGIRDLKSKAAIRTSTVGEPYLEEVAHDLGAHRILEQSPLEAGDIAQKSVGAYKAKANQLWNKLETSLHKHGANLRVSAADPLKWAVEKFSELDDPILKDIFMKSPLGVETKRMMGLNLGLNAESFIEAIQKKPSLLTKDYSFRDVLKYRRNIDNSISNKGWNQIGSIDEGELKHFRGLFSHSIGDGFKYLSPESYKLWNRYNANYSKYAATKIPKINAVTEHEFEPYKAFEASKEGLKGLDSNAQFTMSTLKGGDKEKYALSVIRDLGRNGEKFDLHKFAKNFHDLETPVKKQILGSLSPAVRKDVQTQLGIVKGMNNIVNETQNLGDILYRTPALSTYQKVKKTLIKQLAGSKYKTPEGRQKLTETALRASERPMDISRSEPGRLKTSISSLGRNVHNISPKNELSTLMQEAKNLGIDVDNLLG